MNNDLIKALQSGIDLVSRPFAKVANDLNTSEDSIINGITEGLRDKTIKRFGAVINHRILGYKSNAMVVWNLSDDEVEGVATEIAKYEFVRLCYQRPRRLPHWPYNLFCMVFGKTKEEIESYLNMLILELKLENVEYDILYTTKCYKQTGAKYRK